MKIKEIRINRWTGLHSILFSDGTFKQTINPEPYMTEINEFICSPFIRLTQEGINDVFTISIKGEVNEKECDKLS